MRTAARFLGYSGAGLDESHLITCRQPHPEETRVTVSAKDNSSVETLSGTDSEISCDGAFAERKTG